LKIYIDNFPVDFSNLEMIYRGMKSKALAMLLAYESGLNSEMVTRFQKLREFNLLSKGRGRNAEFLNTDEVVSGILSMVADKTGMAATTVIGLRNLKPAGAQKDAFAGAPTLSAAIAAAIEDEALLATVRKISLGDSDPISSMATSAEIIYHEGGEERTTQYVPATAVSLFQEGMEVGFDRHTLHKQSVSRELVITPRLLSKIAREIREAKTSMRQEDSPLVNYKIWFGLAQSEEEFLSMKPRWMAKARASLHDALWDAMMVNDARVVANGREQVVWEIEGDDGSRFGRDEIANLIQQHRQELTVRPPQKY
jgi:hypothetical protein